MKDIIKILMVFCCTIFTMSPAHAQDDLPSVFDPDNPEDQRLYNQYIDNMIRDLYVYLTEMTKLNGNSHYDRVRAKNNALKLFVNNGNEVHLSTRLTRSALVYTTSKRRKESRPSAVKDYFDTQIYLREHTYTNGIIIEIIGDIAISKIEKVGKGEYRCTATYMQGYRGWKKDKTRKYDDKTVKSIEVWIRPNDPVNKVKLFDIIAKETYPYDTE